MACNYRLHPKTNERCGADTIAGAKMCPEHQQKMREYMREYRAKQKTKAEAAAKRETVEAVGLLIDELLEAQRPKLPKNALVIELPVVTDDMTPEEAHGLELKLMADWKNAQEVAGKALSALQERIGARMEA